MPISGGADPTLADKVIGIPTWIFHGAKDTVVKPGESRKIFQALKDAGGRPRYTEYEDVAHDAWENAYAEEALFAWMRNPTVESSAPLVVKPRKRTPVAKVDETTPFVPALEIPRALSVRMGNNMLAALADSVPQIVPRDVVSGGIADIFDSTRAEGYDFAIRFSGIGYRGEVTRARIKAYGKDQVRVEIGLSNVHISIGSTSVVGPDELFGRKQATAGPISVVLGHRRPVWLSLDVTPVGGRPQTQVKNQQQQLSHSR